MNKILRCKIICALFLLLTVSAAKASHIYGADLYYTYVSGNTYTVTLAVYGDCTGSSFSSLSTSTPELRIFNGNSTYQTTSLQLVSAGTPNGGLEVTPVCASQANNTACRNPLSTIPGVTRFIYSRNVILSGPSANWRFRFTGSMGPNAAAGRSNNITNINLAGAGGGSIIELEATLNNTFGANSSPTFTTIPTPFYCINLSQQYNQGAVDANNDSLKFELAAALENGGTVTYLGGYSAGAPLATTAGAFSFDGQTGQMIFTPNAVQRSLVVNKVTEYRNGVVVGSSAREMTFIVLNNCNNNPPVATIDTLGSNNISGGVIAGNNTINVCEGTPHVSFHFNPSDPDGDSLTLTINGLPASANVTVTNNNTPNPSVDVNWNTSALAPGLYTFYITYVDRGCPLSSQQTIAYTLRVVRPNELVTSITYPTQCVHKAGVRYELAYGLTPRHVEVRQGSTVVRDYNTGSAVITDSLEVGTYTITVTSPLLACPTQYTLQVVDSGVLPFRPTITSPVYYCLNDAPTALVATPATNATLTWYNASGAVVPGPPVPSTAVAGIFQWSVDQLYKVCRSEKDTFDVYVTKRPVASISGPSELCTKDTASISFDGSIGVGPIIAYQWGWDGANYSNGSGAGPWNVHWNDAGSKTLTLQVFENECPSMPVSKTVLVKPTPRALFSLNNACTNTPATIVYNSPQVLSGTDYTWDFDGGVSDAGNNVIGPHHVTWPSAGDKRVSLVVNKDGCIDTSSALLSVYPRPDAEILNKTKEVCYGDKIYLTDAGDGTATWTPVERIMYEPDGRPFTRVVVPTTYHLSVVNQYGCTDEDSVRYDQIVPCCNFSYPNAFSPNGDTKNERFRVLTYGNTETYEFSIYDRWGKRVFWSFDPTDSWDGSYKGEPCQTGTYFYYIKARCLTGRSEEHRGELMLMR